MEIFKKSSVFLSNTEAFEQLILDYLKNDVKTTDLFEFTPDLKGLNSKLESQGERKLNRPILVEVLKEQYSFLDSSSERGQVFERIALLNESETFTICTGHQLNLFTGPLYTIFKIITTIKAAKALQESSGKVILPVFWLASEDHDMEEINHFFIYGQRYEWQTNWEGPSGLASCAGIHELVLQLRSKFSGSTEAGDWLDLLESCYQPSLSLSEATRRFLHALFGKYGLLIIDANDKRLKREFIPELINDVSIHQAERQISGTMEKMSLNYKIQVHPRSVNLFYLIGDKRLRIDYEGENFHLHDGSKSWTQADIEKEILNNPERFSPNVVLRPLYQEKILPNIAMVGGPAEIAYWLELKEFFTTSNISYPVLLLRNSAMFLDEQALNRMTKLHIQTDKLFENVDEWIRIYIKESSSTDFSMDESLLSLDKEFEILLKKLQLMDPTLKASVEAEQHRLKKALRGVEEKLIRSIKKKNESDVSQIHKLHEKLFPQGKLQERTENILPFLFKNGEAFLTEIYEELDPFSKEMVLFTEKTISVEKSSH